MGTGKPSQELCTNKARLIRTCRHLYTRTQRELIGNVVSELISSLRNSLNMVSGYITDFATTSPSLPPSLHSQSHSDMVLVDPASCGIYAIPSAVLTEVKLDRCRKDKHIVKLLLTGFCSIQPPLYCIHIVGATLC